MNIGYLVTVSMSIHAALTALLSKTQLYDVNGSYGEGLVDPYSGYRNYLQRPQYQPDQRDNYHYLLPSFPDLAIQLNDPDPLLLTHDQQAVDGVNRYPGKEIEVAELLIQSLLIPEETGSLVGAVERLEKGYDSLKEIVAEAYRQSSTFRRLFNYAYDQQLHDPAQRWELEMGEATQAVHTGVQDGGERILELPSDVEAARRYYRSGSCVFPFSLERTCLHEVVKGVTQLSDSVSGERPRGPVVEYTNIILKEMGLAEPVRTHYVNDLPVLDSHTSVGAGGGSCLDYAAYLQLHKNVTIAMPDLLGMARNAIGKKIAQKRGQKVSPDKIYLHYFGKTQGANSPQTFLGERHDATPLWSMTSTGAVLMHFSAAEKAFSSDRLNAEYGLNSTECASDGGKNGVSLRPSDLRSMIQEINFSEQVESSLETFWKRYQEQWRTLAKVEFVRAARKALSEGIFSKEEYTHLLTSVVPGIPLDGKVTLAQLRSTRRPAKVRAHHIDINGYAASDILRFVFEDGRTILYIPSVDQHVFFPFSNDDTRSIKPQLFYVFESDAQMREWLVAQARDLQQRFLLTRHFSLYNRQDGTTYTGVANGLKKLAEGDWSASGSAINYREPDRLTAYGVVKIGNTIEGDLFVELAALTKQRSLEDVAKLEGIVKPISSQRKMLQENPTLFQFTAIDQAIGPLLGLCGPIGVSVDIADFAVQIGVKAAIAVNNTAAAENIIALQELFGVSKTREEQGSRMAREYNSTCQTSQRTQLQPEGRRYYRELLHWYPDLAIQLNNSDPLLLIHDQSAVDGVNRYPEQETKIIALLIKDPTIFLEDLGGSTDLQGSANVFKKCYEELKEIAARAYQKGPTFRRLFNYAYDQQLHDPAQRWGLEIKEATQAVHTEVRDGGERILELPSDVEAVRRYYRSDSCTVPLSLKRAFLHEMVKAVTQLPDSVSDEHPRGPVVEYTNIILKEMGFAEPVRTHYVNDLPVLDSHTSVGAGGGHCLDYATYLQLRKNVTAAMPNLPEMARSAMREQIKRRFGKEVDPDAIYLKHIRPPLWSVTLTDLAFKNFDSADEWESADRLDADYAVYWQDLQCEDHNSAKNRSMIKPSELRDLVWKLGFASQVDRKLCEFWNTYQKEWRALAKAEFLRAALFAQGKGILDPDAYREMVLGVAPETLVGNVLQEGITLSHLYKKTAPSVAVHQLDINGYAASDILRFVLKDRREVLYCAGDPQAFYVFRNDQQMKQWVVEQAKDLKKRLHLVVHFSAYNRQDGNSYTGVDNGLQKLAEGDWDVARIDYYEKLQITEDIFDALTLKAKARGFRDADTFIVSDSELRAQRALVIFQAVGMVFSLPLLLCGPIGVALDTTLLVTTIGLEAHIAVAGDSAEERQQAALGAEIDGGMASLFGIAHLGGGGYASARNIWMGDGVAAVEEEQRVFFKAPKRVNGQAGYPLSPIKPPYLPVEEPLLHSLAQPPSGPLAKLPEPVLEAELPEPEPMVGVPLSILQKLPFKDVEEIVAPIGKDLVIGSDQLFVSESVLPELMHKLKMKGFIPQQRISACYSALAKKYPDLVLQLQDPDPLLLEYEQKAQDTSNDFPEGTLNSVVDTFVAKESKIGSFNERIGQALRARVIKDTLEYTVLARIMQHAYQESPTFRRLFNYAKNTLLHAPGNRWLIAPNAPLLTTITEEQLAAAGGKRTIGLNIAHSSLQHYQSQNGINPFTLDRAFLHEVVHALTGLPDAVSEAHPRGPVVEYTNIILKEMGDNSPARISLATPSSVPQLNIKQNYYALAARYPDLAIQTQDLDPALLEHDRVAVNSQDYLSEKRLIDLLLKEHTVFNNRVEPIYENTKTLSTKLAKETREYKFLAPRLDTAYKKSSTFRRLFNRAYEQELQYPAKRWALEADAGPAVVTSRSIKKDGQIVASDSRRIIRLKYNYDIYSDSASQYIDPQGRLQPHTLQRVFIHEVVHALTGLQDVVSTEYPRGPVVEYTNFILKEMGDTDPARAVYVTYKSVSPSRFRRAPLQEAISSSPNKKMKSNVHSDFNTALPGTSSTVGVPLLQQEMVAHNDSQEVDLTLCESPFGFAVRSAPQELQLLPPE